jgi:hypothetical protein
MSDASREWWRTGLYANRSIAMPTRAQTAIAPMVTRIAQGIEGFASSLSALAMKYPANAPSMYTSPWAKLMSRSTPYTIVYPSAISA